MKLIQAFMIIGFLKYTTPIHEVEFQQGYTVDEKPAGKPLVVNASMNLRNIIKVSEKEQTISLEITLRMFWRDDRLSLKSTAGLPRDSTHYNLSYIVQIGEEISKFWLPDLFVDEAIETRNPAYKVPTESLRVYEDSSLRFSKRFNFDVACAMDFTKYPMDRQDCFTRIESFAFTKEDMEFRWLGKDAMDDNPNISLPQYDHKLYTDEKYITNYYKENYSGLIFKIGLLRKMNVHIVQDFLPSFLYVWIAYFAIQMSHRVPQARTAMVLFPMLALTTLTSRVRSEIPAVSVLTFMDIWLISCLAFICSSMVVIVLTAILKRINKDKLWKRIEFWFKILYPVIFLTFSIAYWTSFHDDRIAL